MATPAIINLPMMIRDTSGVWMSPSLETSASGMTTPTEADDHGGSSSNGTKKDSPADPSNAEIGETQDDTPPYHIFTKRQKWIIVCLVSMAGTFSPLSSNIYFPAISSISSDLGVSEADIALTITVYMIVQGISPSLFGAISDSVGRRVTLVTALVIYTGANLGLAFTSSFPMLLVLRGVQAAGSSATISISVGVIADIASASERGGFIGTNAGMRMVGQAIGPVIGGLLNSAWGFRSIFWFLFCLSILALALLVVLLPETQREIAGNGSKSLSGLHRPCIFLARPPNVTGPAATSSPNLRPFKFKKVVQPLAHVFKKDILILLSWGAVVYSLWSMVTSSTTTVLLQTFPRLTQWQIGLCFLPNGIGCVLGSLSTGWLLDKTFKRVEVEYQKQHGLHSIDGKKSKDFPFERARLPLMPYFSFVFIVSLALYGPSYEFNDLRSEFAPNLIASLGSQFILAFTATAVFNINSTMLIDNFPDGAAGATATNNLCRCLLGAVGVSVIQPLIDAVKIRNAFLILAGVAVLFSPLVWVQWKLCEKWRMQRQQK